MDVFFRVCLSNFINDDGDFSLQYKHCACLIINKHIESNHLLKYCKYESLAKCIINFVTYVCSEVSLSPNGKVENYTTLLCMNNHTQLIIL